MNISSKLIFWYLENKRDLPWRNTKDPYTIWIAEVILQQTRVDQGLQYFRRFMERFPDLSDLANADTDEVMKIWQGLGYYSRARNLHETAWYIVQHHNGKIPSTFSGLMELKGIGSYTAAAIASFAFNEDVPVVDGNVVRVLSRLFGVYSVSKKIFFEKAREIMEPGKTALFNQAMMEFGALHCTPVKPLCPTCMFRDECFAYQQDAVRELPAKKEKPKLKKRYFHYFIIRDDQNLLMKKRDGTDIWKGLYDFPMIETKRSVSLTNLMNLTVWKELFGSSIPEIMNYSTIRRHILTHQVIFTRFYMIGAITPRHLTGHHFRVVQLEQLRDLPIPRLIDRFLQETDWLIN